MFKKIEFENKINLMKLLNNEFVEKVGQGRDSLGNFVTVYRDILNNYYYSYTPSITDFFETLQLYLNQNPSLYELFQIRGMALALQAFKGDENINVEKFLKMIDRKIKKLENFDWEEYIRKEIENFQSFDIDNMTTYTYDVALEVLLLRMKERYNV